MLMLKWWCWVWYTWTSKCLTKLFFHKKKINNLTSKNYQLQILDYILYQWGLLSVNGYSSIPQSNPLLSFRSVAQKGPTTEEKVDSISATLETYEAKISGLGKFLAYFNIPKITIR